MSNEEAESLDQITSNENELETVETEEVEAEQGEQKEGEAVEAEGTQPQKQQDNNDWIKKRLSREKRKTEAEAEAKTEAETQLELERERNKLLQLSLEQAKATKTDNNQAPNPDDFDGGEYDPEYKKQAQTYQERKTQELVAKGIQEANAEAERKRLEQQQSQQLEKKQIAHYERALKLGVENYEQVEDEVIDILGEDNINHVINSLDDSENVVLNLWENKDKAREISGLLKTDPIKALVELGRLQGTNLKPDKSVSPNPVEPLEGSSPVSGIERKLNQLQKNYESGKITLQQLLDQKKQAMGTK